MRILRLQGYDPHPGAWHARVAAHLAARPDLAARPWEAQQDALAELGHPAVDGFAAAMRARGHEAWDVLHRFPHVRRAFLRDHDLPLTLADDTARFVLAVGDALRPDVVIERDVGALAAVGVGALRRAVPSVGAVLLHHAVPHVDATTAEVDAVLVVCPAYRGLYREAGARRVEVVNNAFYAPALAHVPELPRDVDLAFVGRSGFGGGAGKWSRFHHLEELMERTPLRCWLGDGDKPMLMGMSRAALRSRVRSTVARTVRPLRRGARTRAATVDPHPQRRPPGDWRPPLRPLAARFPDRVRPGVYGREMLEVLARSRIVFNRGPDREGDCAGTFRIFEATAVGAVLLTDHTSDIGDHFRVGEEIVTYRDMDDCVTTVHELLEDEARRAAIAAAGRRRTLADHTWAARSALVEAVLTDL